MSLFHHHLIFFPSVWPCEVFKAFKQFCVSPDPKESTFESNHTEVLVSFPSLDYWYFEKRTYTTVTLNTHKKLNSRHHQRTYFFVRMSLLLSSSTTSTGDSQTQTEKILTALGARDYLCLRLERSFSTESRN